MWFVIICGIIAFLGFEHPLALLFVFIPLALMFILAAVNFVRKGSFKYITTALVIFIVMVVALLILCIP